MNEQIKVLAIDCAGQMEWDAPKNPESFTFNRDKLQKFAELIIKDQQREWVGLTDEEMMLIYVELKTNVGYYSEEKYARAIEAKLKEKNT